MNASFGIDHPLLATHDIDRLRARLIALGFNMTALGRHPWGTSTSLAMFQGCLIEIMGIYDANLIDEVPAGDFHFGRHIFEHLTTREGVALSALHSTDSRADADRAQAAGFSVAGHLEFGRDVTLPDGTATRTKTTLALLPDADFPRLSFFLCQQHRPELIYVPEWLAHPNSVNAICGVTVQAELDAQAKLRPRLTALYGKATDTIGGFAVQTAQGPMTLMTRDAIETSFAALPSAIAKTEVAIVAMDLSYTDAQAFQSCLATSGLPFSKGNGLTLLGEPEKTANTLLRFRQA